MRQMLLATAIALSSVSSVTVAASEYEIKYGGFMYLDYYYSKDFLREDTHGNSNFGVTKAAFLTKVNRGHLAGKFLLGGSKLAKPNADTFGIKVAVLEINDLLDSMMSISIGAQPFLFGLKPNGYAGDRSIRHGLEFSEYVKGGLSGQAGPSLFVNLKPNEMIAIRLGAFDHEPVEKQLKASGLHKNLLAKVEFATGAIRVAAGYEHLFLPLADKSKGIIQAGVSYDTDVFDISLEYFNIHKDISGTEDNESLLVAELTVKAFGDTGLYVDYATALKGKTTTIRGGVTHMLASGLSAQLEYGRDKADSASGNGYAARLRYAL